MQCHVGCCPVPFIGPICSDVAIHMSGFVSLIHGNVNAATFYDSLAMVFVQITILSGLIRHYNDSFVNN